MARRSWNGASHRRLTVLFLVVLLPPAVTLVWLGFRMLELDRILQARKEKEGREAAAETIVRSITQSMARLETTPETGPFPEGVVRIIVAADSVRFQPAERRLWSERQPTLPEGTLELFADARKAEAQDQPEAALRSYQEQARSTNPPNRVRALMGVARVEWNLKRPDAAIEAFKNVASTSGLGYEGTPADFVARRAICRLLSEFGRSAELDEQAAALETDFLAKRWTLDRARWELGAREIAQWTGHPLVSTERKALNTAADWISENSRNPGFDRSRSRTILLEDLEGTESAPVTILWRAELQALAIAPSAVQSWIEEALKSDSARAGSVSLLTDSGGLFSGEPSASSESTADAVRRNSADTGLPWTVSLSADDRSRAAANEEDRRRLLGLGLAAIVLLLAGGSYFLWRVIGRELEVARLQSEFVAAVSHEFRTPLASLQHITELLEEDDGRPFGAELETRKSFYAALGRNTDRLRRLVESLLDFSRMETGRKPWRLASLDAGELTAEVVADFQQEAGSQEGRVTCDVEESGALWVRADADALTHALWNLLDNARKYSADCAPIHVSVARRAQSIVISVTDQGIGIPLPERRQIFRKFVRGDKALEMGIKGTGLGLAIVSHIAEAHGGDIELESEDGNGSAFRLVLPMDGQPVNADRTRKEKAPA